MDYSRIPEELKNQNQWVCAWDGSKVPMRAFERKAASSTARTLGLPLSRLSGRWRTDTMTTLVMFLPIRTL